jgi:hypothetical protein
MFDNYYVETKERASGALELSLQIRDREKENALLAGQYRNIANPRAKRNRNFLKSLLTVLFASL